MFRKRIKYCVWYVKRCNIEYFPFVLYKFSFLLLSFLSLFICIEHFLQGCRCNIKLTLANNHIGAKCPIAIFNDSEAKDQ